MLAEFGMILPVGMSALYKGVPEILEDGENGLSFFVRASAHRQLKHLKSLEEQCRLIEQEITAWFRTQPACHGWRILRLSDRPVFSVPAPDSQALVRYLNNTFSPACAVQASSSSCQNSKPLRSQIQRSPSCLK